MTTTGGCLTTTNPACRRSQNLQTHGWFGRTRSGSAQQPVLSDRAMVVSNPPAEIFTRTSLAIIAPVNLITFEKTDHISGAEFAITQAGTLPADAASGSPVSYSLTTRPAGETSNGRKFAAESSGQVFGDRSGNDI